MIHIPWNMLSTPPKIDQIVKIKQNLRLTFESNNGFMVTSTSTRIGLLDNQCL